jgi:hypothetical protein
MSAARGIEYRNRETFAGEGLREKRNGFEDQ